MLHTLIYLSRTRTMQKWLRWWRWWWWCWWWCWFFLLFCLFHVSSADEFLLQTGVVRQGVKYSCWHFYGFAQFLKSFSDFSFMYCFVKLRAFVIIHCLNNWKSNWVKNYAFNIHIYDPFYWLKDRWLFSLFIW